jgi:hypothetical protein
VAAHGGQHLVEVRLGPHKLETEGLPQAGEPLRELPRGDLPASVASQYFLTRTDVT